MPVPPAQEPVKRAMPLPGELPVNVSSKARVRIRDPTTVNELWSQKLLSSSKTMTEILQVQIHHNLVYTHKYHHSSGANWCFNVHARLCKTNE